VPTPVGLGLSASATTVAPGASTTISATVVNFSNDAAELTDAPGLTLPGGPVRDRPASASRQLTGG